MTLAKAILKIAKKLQDKGFTVVSDETKTGIRLIVSHDERFASPTVLRAVRFGLLKSDGKDRKLVVCSNTGDAQLVVELR